MKPTQRQAQIAAMVAHGLSDKSIAQRLNISPKTVANHIQAISKQMPGEGSPRHRLTMWFLTIKAIPENGHGP